MNTGVDDIRNSEKISYPPIKCRYRIYIIGLVHMLNERLNALLKTLESLLYM
jgi:DNA polymerase III gamma/tau subunit